MKFNLQSKHAITKNGWGQSSGNNFSCDYPRHVFVKEKEFYSVNGAYVLTNDEDATKCFYSVSATTKQHSPYAQDPRPQSGLRTWPKN